jgi:excisionase family DNA binding protein
MELAISIIEAAKRAGVGRSTIYAEISKGNLKVRRVGRFKVLKYATAIYFLLGIGVPGTINLTDWCDFKFLASVKKYEFRGFIHQTEIGLEFELGLGGCATRNQNKMAEEEGFEPSVGY